MKKGRKRGEKGGRGEREEKGRETGEKEKERTLFYTQSTC